MYTIGNISQMFQLPVSTLRYYDQEDLFPELKRVSGIRQFSHNEIEALRVIECLKKSGLEIKEIKQFMEWTKKGPETFEVRRDLFEKQRQNMIEEMEKMEKVLAMINFKCWYYEEAIKTRDEQKVNEKIPQDLPEKIKKDYLLSH